MAYSAAFSQSISIMAAVAIGAAREDCKYLSIKSISEKLEIPVPSIKRLISMLKRTGLLETKAGIDGGLALSRPVEQITLYDIFDAVEGINPLFKLYAEFDYANFQGDRAEVEKMVANEAAALNDVETGMLDRLRSVTLATILSQ